jgi:hypothetical protein
MRTRKQPNPGSVKELLLMSLWSWKSLTRKKSSDYELGIGVTVNKALELNPVSGNTAVKAKVAEKVDVNLASFD